MKKLFISLMTAFALFGATMSPIMAQEVVPAPTGSFSENYNNASEQIARIQEEQAKMQAQNPLTQFTGTGTADVSGVSIADSFFRSGFTLLFVVGGIIGVAGAMIRFFFMNREYKLQKELVRLEKERLENGQPAGSARFVTSNRKIKSSYYGGSAANLTHSNPAGDTNCDGVVDSRDINIPFGM